MNINKLTNFSLAVVVAAQCFSIGVAEAKHPKSIQIYKTFQKEALEDRYFQIKSYKIKELTNEEALEFVNEGQSKLNLNDKGFKGPGIPNIPPVPPAAGARGDATSVTPAIADPATVPGPVTATAPSGGGVLDNVIMVLDKLVAIGQKIIPIIKEGKSVVTNSSMNAISVLPLSDTKDPVVHEMGGWSIPVSKHYKISYVNGLGLEVVSFVYSVSFQYNGSSNGKGKYLTGVRASARSIDVMYGFDVDATSQLIQISNIGTQANVIAGATIEMAYTVKNWTRTTINYESFHVTGDGRIFKLDN